ncbi:MAG: ATP-dependent RecD-like DNA helicase, partial [Oscillospiraceae bacterium]|nr:ATP-dependent RecD-like DNA helicase [Oscillospiraceae bacterium]
MAEGTDKIKGVVAGIVFRNSDNGYTVMRLENDEGETVTAVGCIPGAAEGDRLELTGEWMTHPSYGLQFRSSSFVHLLPKTVGEIYAYLASGGIKGVGAATAKNIVARFGEDTFDIMEFHPERLSEIKGISLKKARGIGRSFRERTGMRALTEYLNGCGLSPSYAVKLYNCFGDEAMAALKDDPYILIAPYFGASFNEADKLAAHMGFMLDSPMRVRGAILYTLRQGADRGSVCLPEELLIDTASRMMKIDPPVLKEGLDDLAESCDVVREDEKVYLSELYEAERYIVSRLARMTSQPPEAEPGLSEFIASIETHRGLKYAGEQRKAVYLAGTVQVMAITGGPGTGKTTAIRGILDLYKMMGLKAVLAAPTGRAAKRMSEVTGEEAATLHRLLGAGYAEDGEGSAFEKCENDPLDCDAVILDESSMVDIILMHALLAAMPSNCRLVMVGDADQLPSVGPGTVFSDLIASGVVEVVRLMEIFRQAKDSRIVKNAHLINMGELPDLKNEVGDCYYLNRCDGAGAADTIVELCSKRLEAMGLSPRDIQVLTPTRKGLCGTAELNRRLQEALNPPSPEKNEKQFGDFVFREGDRVMQIKNN